jgi:WD40 repeat protein
VKVWDAVTGQTLQTYARKSDEAYALAWSPDGPSSSPGRGYHIAVGGDNKMVQIWDPESGKVMLIYTGHNATIFGVAWSPDGKEIASASSDTTVQVWRPEP